MRKLRNQRGVAMVTVLFVGAALTAVASTATFVTIQEFRASSDDRRAAEALALAESGIDRFLIELRTNKWTWGQIRQAGCVTTENTSGAPLTLNGDMGTGRTFSVKFTVHNPTAANPADRFPPAACTTTPPRPTNPRTPSFFLIESTGVHPAAKRIVRQTVEIGVLNLPVGIYADSVVGGGTPSMNGISLISAGDVTDREKFGFSGTDPYYTLKDFWPALSDQTRAPAAVHATGHVYMKNNINENQQEHYPTKPLNCSANRTTGANPGGSGQSSWDQSADGNNIPAPLPEPQSCAAWVGAPTGPPPTSLFTDADRIRVTPKPSLSDQDYITLRDAARRTGLYCRFNVAGIATGCLRNGSSWVFGGLVSQLDVDAVAEQNFVAYFEFDNVATVAANDVRWAASVLGCNPTPGRSIVLIVRQGNLLIAGNDFINGAIIVPEGDVRVTGNGTINGTIIAKRFDNRGGASYQLNDCWINNMPGPFLSVVPQRWSEIDR